MTNTSEKLAPNLLSDLLAQTVADLAGTSVDVAILAPRPKTLSETGLSMDYVCDLVCKHLLGAGAITLAELSKRIMLPGSILEEVLHFLRQEAFVEVLGVALDRQGLRYNLTDRGRSAAMDAEMRNGYVGPAPVTLAAYKALVDAQSIHAKPVSREMIESLFSETVVPQGSKDRLGLAVNSGRAMFVYGAAGSGKTYLTAKLAQVFEDSVLIPHAIIVGEATIPVFDPVMHKVIERDDDSSIRLETGHDQRLQRCHRPVVTVGGELTDSMLDVQYDAVNKIYMAPLQLKANNGVFIIDDMGRQKVPPEVIFNRWIVPMEEKHDYLSVGSGKHFVVPFDEVLIFSTNLHPLDLADEAFLRRIGYKIEFPTLQPQEYRLIWSDVCRDRQVECAPEVLDHVLEMHGARNVPMLPCHPRDLIGIAVDHTVYAGQPRQITTEHLDLAWNAYFVSVDDGAPEHHQQTEVER